MARKKKAMYLSMAMYASSAILAIGITMWLYGSLIDVAHLASTKETIAYGELFKVHAQLDPYADYKGVYIVRVDRLEEGAVTYELIDPLGHDIINTVLDRYSIDRVFPISTAGTYTLIVKNNGDPTSIEGAVGPAPSELRAQIGHAGFAVMIAGIAATSAFSAILVKKLLF